MVYTKIPEADAVRLIQALGLLMSQAGVYGYSHNVTQRAACRMFSEMEQAIRVFGPIEIALREQHVLVNGSPDGVSDAIGKNLADRMGLHKSSGLLFLAPPDLHEFLRCVTLFGMQPLALTAEGGFANAMKTLHSIKVVTVAYLRVDAEEAVPALKKQPEKQPEEPPTPSPAIAPPFAFVPRRPAASPVPGVLDLSEAWSAVEEASRSGQYGPAGQVDQKTQSCQRRSSDLAELLREAATLLEEDEGISTQDLPPSVADALSRIRGILSDMAAGSERQITTFANRVKDDRQTIASIESAARRRGIGLKLTRAELMQQYAELNQEIVQPLTVSTGVIDMLHSGCAGALSESQRELLKMAAESVGRVNQLVSHMSRITGLPDTYTPDAAVVADSYR